jgi:hypothetical protein
MKSLALTLTLICGLTLVGGCTIGNGRICGPQTPAAYCDAKALKALLNPPPYLDLWDKPGATANEKMADWIACGGKPNGEFIPSEEMKRVWRRPEDTTSIPSYHRADAHFQRCLMGRGLVWIGRCDSESMRTFPVCGAP